MIKIKGARLLVSPVPEANPKSTVLEVISYTDEGTRWVVAVAVGDGARDKNGVRQHLPVWEGDVVLLRHPVQRCGAPVEIDGIGIDDLYIVNYDDVLARQDGLDG